MAKLRAEAVFGPPGTGKTTWLISRVKALITKGQKPDSIMLLSHTKAAAQEMVSRIPEVDRPRVSTIHSVAYRAAGVSKSQVVDPPKIKQFMAHFGVGYRGASREEGPIETGDEFLSAYNYGTNRMMPLDEAFQVCGAPGGADHFQSFCESYKSWKGEYGFVDFNDMLLDAMPELHKESTQTILVDEAQDLTPLQWEALAHLLEGGTRDVAVVGDDDQSIFGWGGADPEGMQTFMDKHRARKTVLSQSWRVPMEIHKRAVQLIGTVSKRVPKVYHPTSNLGEWETQTDFKHVPVDAGRDTLILYRTHHFRKEMEQVLIDQRMPYSCLNGYPSLFDNRYARAVRILRNGWTDRRQMEAVKATMKDDVRASFKGDIDLQRLQRMGWRKVLNVPFFMWGYLEEVDLDATSHIRMSTIHGAKGMEADHVVLHAGITERIATEMVENPDGEARVFYVGLTRAKQRIDIVLGDQPYPNI